MGAQRTVALSLDIESHLIWEQLPKGERSRRVREALSVAQLVLGRDAIIESLENQIQTNIHWIRKLRMSNQELRDFKCGRCRCACVVGSIGPGDIEGVKE